MERHPPDAQQAKAAARLARRNPFVSSQALILIGLRRRGRDSSVEGHESPRALPLCPLIARLRAQAAPMGVPYTNHDMMQRLRCISSVTH